MSAVFFKPDRINKLYTLWYYSQKLVYTLFNITSLLLLNNFETLLKRFYQQPRTFIRILREYKLENICEEIKIKHQHK